MIITYTDTLTLIWAPKHILHAIATVLTKHSPRWHRFSVQPERHLGKNDCHDAREVRLDDKVADLPLQMEMSRHHCVFTYAEMIQGQLPEQHSCHSDDHFLQTPDFFFFIFFFIAFLHPETFIIIPKYLPVNNDSISLFLRNLAFPPFKYSPAHNQCQSHVSQKATASPDGCRLQRQAPPLLLFTDANSHSMMGNSWLSLQAN